VLHQPGDQLHPHPIFESLPCILSPTMFDRAYTSLAQNYLDATEGRRMCFKITAINAAVWLLWKLPSARIAMMTSFTHNPLSGLSYTLLTSMFRYRLFPDIAIVLQRRWKNDL